MRTRSASPLRVEDLERRRAHVREPQLDAVALQRVRELAERVGGLEVELGRLREVERRPRAVGPRAAVSASTRSLTAFAFG